MGTVQGDAMEPLAFSVAIKGSPLQEKVKRKWEKAKCGAKIDPEAHNCDKAKASIAEKLRNAEQRREVRLVGKCDMSNSTCDKLVCVGGFEIALTTMLCVLCFINILQNIMVVVERASFIITVIWVALF